MNPILLLLPFLMSMNFQASPGPSPDITALIKALGGSPKKEKNEVKQIKEALKLFRELKIIPPDEGGKEKEKKKDEKGTWVFVPERKARTFTFMESVAIAFLINVAVIGAEIFFMYRWH